LSTHFRLIKGKEDNISLLVFGIRKMLSSEILPFSIFSSLTFKNRCTIFVNYTDCKLVEERVDE